jgi:hypothetical protein
MDTVGENRQHYRRKYNNGANIAAEQHSEQSLLARLTFHSRCLPPLS